MVKYIKPVHYNHDIIASSFAIWTKLSITGDTRADQSRVKLAQRLVIQVVLLK